MTPERLQLWIYKPVPGGRVLHLVHEQAIGQNLTVASWTREDVDEAREGGVNQAEQLLDAAQDHADGVGEACRFLIQWCNEGATRPLRSMVHRAQPVETPTNEHALRADHVSPNAMVGQLLNHISQQQRVINGSIGAVLAAYERALNMQQATMLAQQALIVSSREQLHELAVTPVTSEADEELSRLKARALEKLLEFAPDAVSMGMKAAVSHIAAKSGEKLSKAHAAQAAATQAARANGRKGQALQIASRARPVELEPDDDDDSDPDDAEDLAAGGHA